MPFAEQIRARLTGMPAQMQRREAILAAILAEFAEGGASAVTDKLKDPLDRLKCRFKDKFTLLKDSLQ